MFTHWGYLHNITMIVFLCVLSMVSSWRDCAPYGKYLLYNFCQYTSALSLAGIRSLIPSGCFSELFFMRSGIIFQPEKSSLTIEKSNKIMHNYHI